MKMLRMSESDVRAYEEKMAKFGRVRKHVLLGERPPKKSRYVSPLEIMMEEQIIGSDLPRPTREYRALPNRKYRMDFAWPDCKFALECDGSVHRIKARFLSDIERHNLITLAGWKVLRVGRLQIKSGQAMTWLRELFHGKQV